MSVRFPIKPPLIIVQPSHIASAAPPSSGDDSENNMEAVEIIEAERPVKIAPQRLALRRMYWSATQWLLIALGLQVLSGLMPPIVEVVYSQTLYQYIVYILSALNKLIGVSLGELLFIVLGLWFLGWTIWYSRRAFRGEARIYDVVKLLFLHLLWTFSILFAAFLLVWGLNYQRMPVQDTLHLDMRPPQNDEVNKISKRIVEGINRSYNSAALGQNWARTSTLPMDRAKLHEELEVAFQKAGILAEVNMSGLGPPKEMVLSRLSSLFGITGVYMPFTGETTLNHEVPPSELPFAMARQKAFQRGFARPSEANFIAYIACIHSSHDYIKYSGYLHASKVVEAMERGGGTGGFSANIGPGPSADLQANIDFWKSAKSPFAVGLADTGISTFLRLNTVRRGMDNYDEDIPLIIAYHLRETATTADR